jgi:hypothetical protein
MTEPDPQLAAALRRVAAQLDARSTGREVVYGQYVRDLAELAPLRDRRSLPIVAIAAALVLVALIGGLAWRGTPDKTAVAQVPAGSRVLLTATGWGIVRYDEMPEGPGIHAETTFARADGVRVDLHERASDYNDEFMVGAPNATVLGQPATITDTPDHRTFWRRGTTDLELRGAMELSDAEWRTLLESLRPVDEATWRGALPKSVVLPDQRAEVVQLVLTGVPIPPGFDVEALTRGDTATTNDRYQVGAVTLGAVVCSWIDEWTRAGARGDDAARQRAYDALASSARWPFLREMDEQGDYPEAIWQVAGMLADPTRRGAENGLPFHCSR